MLQVKVLTAMSYQLTDAHGLTILPRSFFRALPEAMLLGLHSR